MDNIRDQVWKYELNAINTTDQLATIQFGIFLFGGMIRYAKILCYGFRIMDKVFKVCID